MITFKNKARIFMREGHQVIDYRGNIIGVLSDPTQEVVSIQPLADRAFNALRHVADSIGYSLKGYVSLSYEHKKNIKHLKNLING